MERPTRIDNTPHQTGHANSHDLEQWPSLAEQRYAAARDASDKARSELREITHGKAPKPHLVKSARARLDAVTARCMRLRRLIDDLEDRLEI
ncbi:MAG: hypothetical protein H7Y89_14610 [Steroidobacteraceae bacterium]|nr:hypothetical protein [Steroidobacteraceae bacterium]